MPSKAWVGLAWTLLFPPSAWSQGGLGGGGPPIAPPAGAHCVSLAERALARTEPETPVFAPESGPLLTGPPPYLVYPIAGGYDQDLFTGNFVDLDPGSGVLSWNCGAYTYNTHAGIDSGLRTFDEQLIGVPIFAAADGIVTDTQDGNPDMNTTWPNLPANYVIIAHPGQRTAYYWHLKNGSVAVAAGQSVKAGQQIGLMGSSGVSGGPHLHFETRDQNSTLLTEPFAGPCRAGPSHWKEQPPAPGALYLSDFGLARTVPPTGPPFSVARDPRYLTTDPVRYYWMTVHHIPSQTTWRVRWLRPNGTVALDAGPTSFGNTEHWPWAWWWFQWWVPDMATTPGTWTLILDFNGVTALTAPVVVALPSTAFVNRPPEPITASITPANPGLGDPLTCRVGGELVKDDLDWDIVRFHYLWRVNGVTVRELTSAARTDTLPHHSASLGATVTCTVTPSDGQAAGAPAVAAATIQALTASRSQISLAQGACTDLRLDAGPAAGSAPFAVAGSLSGAAPGTPLGGSLVLPLNLDSLTAWMLQFPNTPPYFNTLGTLNSEGATTSSLVLPAGLPPALAGLALTHAGIAFGSPWIITNAVSTVLAP